LFGVLRRHMQDLLHRSDRLPDLASKSEVDTLVSIRRPISFRATRETASTFARGVDLAESSDSEIDLANSVLGSSARSDYDDNRKRALRLAHALRLIGPDATGAMIGHRILPVSTTWDRYSKGRRPAPGHSTSTPMIGMGVRRHAGQ